jgi:4-oxalocrotonate tautomerase family enzyme
MPYAQLNVPVGVPRPMLALALANLTAALVTVMDTTPDRVAVWVNEVDRELWAAPGPVVAISVLEGRPKEVLQHLIREATAGVARAVGCDRSIVRVIVTPVSSDLWGIGGLPATVVRAEELATRHRSS